MKSLLPALLCTTVFVSPLPAQDAKPPQGNAAAEAMDWPRAQSLLQRERSGEKLSPEDQAYLDRAKQMRRPGAGAAARSGSHRKAPETLTPITDLGKDGRHEGEAGGLYGGGLNQPPPEHAKVARERLAGMQPLGPDGKPAVDGRIVLVSLSMSNATQEFSTFKRDADASPLKSPHLVIVDCAQGGQAMAEWAPPEARPWDRGAAPD